MKFTLLGGTPLAINAMLVTLTNDTEVEVSAASYDELAETLSTTSPKAYALHLGALRHEETVERDVDGKRCKVKLNVAYGVGGSRLEEVVGDPEPIKAESALPPIVPVEEEVAEVPQVAVGRFPDEVQTHTDGPIEGTAKPAEETSPPKAAAKAEPAKPKGK